MALYQVSTRSTRRRRLGVMVRAWLSGGRHRAEGRSGVIVGSLSASPTRRLPRFSLIQQHAALTQPMRPERRIVPPTESTPALAPVSPAPHAEGAAPVALASAVAFAAQSAGRAARHRAVAYPNAYRGR